MKTVVEMARESWLDTYGLGKDRAIFVVALERFAELVRADERETRETLETLYTDANYIFNNPPGEASQEVRDVIEWYASSIRARSNT